MIPRATTPATVRVSGELMTFSNAVGSGFGARPLGRGAGGSLARIVAGITPGLCGCRRRDALCEQLARALPIDRRRVLLDLS
jgi:hypothetical protein